MVRFCCWLFLVYFFTLLQKSQGSKCSKATEAEARTYIEKKEPEVLKHYNEFMEAYWNYQTNYTKATEGTFLEVFEKEANFAKDLKQNLKKYEYVCFKNESLKRHFELHLQDIGDELLSEEKLVEMELLVANMSKTFSDGTVCGWKNQEKCDVTIEDIQKIMAESRDPEELKFYWLEWHKVTGAANRRRFERYVELRNEAARAHNVSSGAEVWLSHYGDPTIEEQAENILKTLDPLFKQLHAFVRYKLVQHYGKQHLSENGPIPMHLLGDMWAQIWSGASKILAPFPNSSQINITAEMIDQKFTVRNMFEMGDEFFKSLGLKKLPDSFWSKSILEKVTDGRHTIFYPSAWNFYLPDDVRIAMETEVNMKDLYVVHHELGHVQYTLQHQHLPAVFQQAPNPAFHEAIGDVIALSVMTTKHLKKVGLLKHYKEDHEAEINQLFLTAIDKLAFIPFAYSLDKFRWGVFRGEITPNNYNRKFWEIRRRYSGVEPPEQRSEKNFDVASKYHVLADIEYLRYMFSFIVQFQFYEALCKEAEDFEEGNSAKPLHNCDFHGSKKAGLKLEEMLKLGASVAWPNAMEILTGQKEIKSDSLVKYFEPLAKWLKEQQQSLGYPVGWDELNNDKI